MYVARDPNTNFMFFHKEKPELINGEWISKGLSWQYTGPVDFFKEVTSEVPVKYDVVDINN